MNIKPMKVLLTAALVFNLVGCSLASPSSSHPSTKQEVSINHSTRPSVQQVDHIDTTSYPHALDVTQVGGEFLFEAMDGRHEIRLQADHAWQGQLIIEDMSTNEQSAYDYDLQLISSQPIPFNFEGFSGPGWTQTNMQLVLKEEPETQVYLSPTDQGELALAYSNSLLFDTVNETEPSLSLSLSPVTSSWEDGTVGVAVYPDPYLQVIRTC